MVRNGAVTDEATHQAIQAVFRIERARLIGGLARLVRDVGLAEELAQDALVIALERWPETGVPRKPGAWLMAAAKHKAIDQLRRRRLLERKHAELGRELEAEQPKAPNYEEALDDEVGDDLLRLMFVACHPVLPVEARTALTLRLLCGLTTEEIARAFLVPEPTIAQRIVRAKRTLAKAGVPFEVPRGDELAARLGSVLEVVYLVFNEGYAATAGEDLIRPALCDEALRLGRILARLAPGEPEVHGLVALMELQASRLNARVGPDGAPVLLPDQDRRRWDRLLIRRGLAALATAEALGGADGMYVLQAAIAACHARAAEPAATDWGRIAALYGELAGVTGSPVVELNRAVAVGMAAGPAAGLALVEALAGQGALQRYHLLHGVRGDLLARLGRGAEARAEFQRAAKLTRNAAERAFLLRRAAACGGRAVNRRLPPLGSLRAFEAAARHESFAKAADELAVTPAAVSQQIRQLEADLGVSLFRRLPRGLVLTQAGRSALPELGKAFAHLARAVEGVRGGSLVGPLVVSVDPLLRRALAGAAAGRVPGRLSRDRDHGPLGAAQRRLRARGRRSRHPLRQGDLSRAGRPASC